MNVTTVNPISSWQSEGDSLAAIAKSKLTRIQKSGPAIREKVAPVTQRMELPANFNSILKSEVQQQMGKLTRQTVDLLDRSADFQLQCKPVRDMTSTERAFFLIGTLRTLHDERLVVHIRETQMIRDAGVELIVCNGLTELGIELVGGRSGYYSLNTRRRMILVDAAQCQSIARRSGTWTEDVLRAVMLHEFAHSLLHTKRITFRDRLEEEEVCWRFACSYAQSPQELQRFQSISSTCLQSYK